MKKILVIIPHPDDEINLCGGLIYDLCQTNSYDVYIVFTTNGNGKHRIREALDSCYSLGVKRNKVIFLGYPDGFAIDDKNIYNYDGNTDIYTSCLDEYPEYYYSKNKKHKKINRNSVIDDFKKLIYDLLPDIIVCVDYDKHPDHRATSLFFEETMGTVLKENSYRPIVLKGFAYAGKWTGRQDYYNFKETNCINKKYLLDDNYDLDNPYYSWENRIIYNYSKNIQTKLLTKNPLFVAAKKHKSQPAWFFCLRTINSDDVFWQRRTDSLLNNGCIQVSSGDKQYLNDFKLFDTDNVRSKENGIKTISKGVWKPDKDDKDKKIDISFSDNKHIEEIKIYEGLNSIDSIERIKISFDNKESKEYKFEKTNKIKNIIFNTEKVCKKITISFFGNIEVSEIEVFENDNKNVNFLHNEKTIEIDKISIIQKIEYYSLLVVYKFNKLINKY